MPAFVAADAGAGIPALAPGVLSLTLDLDVLTVAVGIRFDGVDGIKLDGVDGE